MNTMDIIRWIPLVANLLMLGFLVWAVNTLIKKNAEIFLLKKDVSHLEGQREILMSTVGPDVVLWTSRDNGNLELIPKIPPEKTVVISATDLHVISVNRYAAGLQENNWTINSYPQCGDKAYDGLYRDHVNDLTQVAKDFHGLGQLRSRVADKVINFRHRIAAMQNGLEQIPGKKNPPANVKI